MYDAEPNQYLRKAAVQTLLQRGLGGPKQARNKGKRITDTDTHTERFGKNSNCFNNIRIAIMPYAISTCEVVIAMEIFFEVESLF